LIHPGSQLKVVHLLLKDVHLLLKVCVRKKKQIQRCNHVLLVLLEDRLEGSLEGSLEGRLEGSLDCGTKPSGGLVKPSVDEMSTLRGLLILGDDPNNLFLNEGPQEGCKRLWFSHPNHQNKK